MSTTTVAVKELRVQVDTKSAGEAAGLEEGQFVAYASVFGNKDSYGDVVVKGAFADSLKEWAASGDPIPVYWVHQMAGDPFMNLGEVLTAVEDDHGLKVTAQLDIVDNPKAAYVYRLLKAGRVKQMSFAFDVIDGAIVTKDEETVYELRKLRLHEVSVVPIGANQETEVLAVKSATQVLAEGIKAGRTLSAKNESAIRDACEQMLEALDTSDEGKAAGTTDAKSAAHDDDPAGAKSTAADDEPTPSPSANSVFAAQATIYALIESAEGGS